MERLVKMERVERKEMRAGRRWRFDVLVQNIRAYIYICVYVYNNTIHNNTTSSYIINEIRVMPGCVYMYTNSN